MSNLMPDEMAQKIVNNPNGYTNESVFLAEAYLAGIEMAMQDADEEDEPENEHKYLFKFYGVNNYKDLVTVQSEHVDRLQKQVPKITDRAVNTSALRQG